MVFYGNPVRAGTDAVASLGDGQTINVKWFKAYATTQTNKIAYHIYYSTNKDDVFTEGIKFISTDDSLQANIIDLIPGQEYFFAVRPIEYDPTTFNPDLDLPLAYDNLRIYPTSVLRQNISSTDLIIPLMDTTDFPNFGIVKVGVELIQYLAIDHVNNNLILTSLDQRGYRNTFPLSHTVDGFDGYDYWDPTVRFYALGEDNRFDRIFACQSRFEYPNYAMTIVDGFKQVTKDLLTTDLSAADAANVGFPMFDFSGFHRTDPVQLLNGTCVGSYIGGEQGCIDGYGNINIVRGLSLQDQNTQRQDVLFSVTGRPAVLIRKMQTGIVCSCYLPSSEYPDDRCGSCHGTKFVLGYEQYFNPRRSDGRILVRPGPTDEALKMYEAGLESEFPLSFETLTVPTIKPRDIIVLFDQDDNEEFRYEVMTVTRNNTVLGQEGGQLFKTMRIRKYDPAYQIRIFRNTAEFPSVLLTGIGFTAGIAPHTHQIVISEKTLISGITSINQTTSISESHNHQIINGVIQPDINGDYILHHTHSIILP